MRSRKVEFTVGVFVVCGICIGLLAVIWLGMSRFFEQGHSYATYFNESVQGLDRDSPVKYRGVSIGRVQRIGVAPDGNLIEVVLKIESGQKLDSAVVAQLKAVGITGSMFIELDRRKPGEPDRTPALTFPSEYPIVGSKPSDITVLLQNIDEVVGQIKALDVPGISERLKRTLDSTNDLLAAADIKTAAARFTTILDTTAVAVTRLERSLAAVERITVEHEQDIAAAIEQFRDATQQAHSLLAKSGELVGSSTAALAQVRPQMLSTVHNLEQASERLSQMLEVLAAQPAQLLIGKPPQPRDAETEENER